MKDHQGRQQKLRGTTLVHSSLTAGALASVPILGRCYGRFPTQPTEDISAPFGAQLQDHLQQDATRLFPASRLSGSAIIQLTLLFTAFTTAIQL